MVVNDEVNKDHLSCWWYISKASLIKRTWNVCYSWSPLTWTYGTVSSGLFPRKSCNYFLKICLFTRHLSLARSKAKAHTMVAYGGHVWRPIRRAKQITKYQLTTRGQPQAKGRDRNNSRKGTGVPSKPVAKSEPGHFEPKSRPCCCGKGNGSQSKLKLGKSSTTEYANSRWCHGTQTSNEYHLVI